MPLDKPSIKVKLNNYWLLMRFDKPIGIYLVLWPTLWGLFFAAQGLPKTHLLIIFTLGCILMRAAGCVINDYADRNFDKHVTRTKDRPLTSGRVSEKEALLLFTVLCILAFVLVLFTNTLTIMLSVVALFLAIIYPYTKRFISLPQAWLGIAFGWGIPMAFAAQLDLTNFADIPLVAWKLLLANICWAIAYDTMYAMVDKEDDLKVGIKSSAILFANYDRLIIAILQIAMLILLVDVMTDLGHDFITAKYYFLGVLIASCLMLYQQFLIKDQKHKLCFKAFLNNHWAGLSILIGIILHFQLN